MNGGSGTNRSRKGRNWMSSWKERNGRKGERGEISVAQERGWIIRGNGGGGDPQLWEVERSPW